MGFILRNAYFIEHRHQYGTIKSPRNWCIQLIWERLPVKIFPTSQVLLEYLETLVEEADRVVDGLLYSTKNVVSNVYLMLRWCYPLAALIGSSFTEVEKKMLSSLDSHSLARSAEDLPVAARTCTPFTSFSSPLKADSGKGKPFVTQWKSLFPAPGV